MSGDGEQVWPDDHLWCVFVRDPQGDTWSKVSFFVGRDNAVKDLAQYRDEHPGCEAYLVRQTRTYTKED